jgi:hypothetical protein
MKCPLDETRTGPQQAVELAAGLELIQPDERSDTLPHLVAGSKAFYDLEVDAPSTAPPSSCVSVRSAFSFRLTYLLTPDVCLVHLKLSGAWQHQG